MCSVRFLSAFCVKMELLWLIIGKYLSKAITLARKLYIFDRHKC